MFGGNELGKIWRERGDLNYVFDKKQIETKNVNDAEAFVKNAFKSLLSKQLEPVNGVVNSDLFNTIWNNQSLRDDIWDSSLYQNLTKSQAETLFQAIISDTNNDFYNFIKVK